MPWPRAAPWGASTGAQLQPPRQAWRTAATALPPLLAPGCLGLRCASQGVTVILAACHRGTRSRRPARASRGSTSRSWARPSAASRTSTRPRPWARRTWARRCRASCGRCWTSKATPPGCWARPRPRAPAPARSRRSWAPAWGAGDLMASRRHRQRPGLHQPGLATFHRRILPTWDRGWSHPRRQSSPWTGQCSWCITFSRIRSRLCRRATSADSWRMQSTSWKPRTAEGLCIS
mmetsp:Transcript_65407/g.191404  ORF Transcript_65407/g.191404 Transcript_65407/m.191404 type:complete len:234 (-) Transcript_65407:2338-3039(-)